MRRPSLTRLLTAVTFVGASGGAALAAGQPGGGGEPPPSRAVQQVDEEQAARYGVLRRARTADDDLSARHRDFIDREVTHDNGAAARLARRATTTPSGDAVYVLPARRWICLFVSRGEAGGGGCNRTSEALEGHMIGVDWPASGVTRVVGLVPDGVREVVLRADDGSTERTAPENNAFAFETARRPMQVEWGDAVIPLPAPPQG